MGNGLNDSRKRALQGCVTEIYKGNETAYSVAAPIVKCRTGGAAWPESHGTWASICASLHSFQVWPQHMILKRLKEATHSRHTALESQLPLLETSLSRARYLHFLQLFWGYYAPLEAQLQALPHWNALAFDYAGRHKTRQLVQDLCALGESPEAIEALARCQQLPTLTRPGHLLGCLYVIEGATLGGQIITRHLEANLGLTPLAGAAFFGGYGARTGSQWKAYCAMLQANAGESSCQDDILVSANQTFETLGQWLFPTHLTPQSSTA